MLSTALFEAKNTSLKKRTDPSQGSENILQRKIILSIRKNRKKYAFRSPKKIVVEGSLARGIKKTDSQNRRSALRKQKKNQ